MVAIFLVSIQTFILTFNRPKQNNQVYPKVNMETNTNNIMYSYVIIFYRRLRSLYIVKALLNLLIGAMVLEDLP